MVSWEYLVIELGGYEYEKAQQLDEYGSLGWELVAREGDHFRLCSFSYSARGDEQKFEVNPHRTIPFTFIRDGLKEALARISEEMAQIEKELQ